MSKTQIDDGGFAFPMPGTDHNYTETGMTLRDWFAGQALAGFCGNRIHLQSHPPEITASEAYRYADALLAERKIGGAA